MTEEKVARNKVVYVTYSIIDQSGNVFEQSDVPVGYVHGGNSPLFEKIEMALDGHKVGDQVEVSLDPTEGFGPHDPNLTFTDEIENVPLEFRRLGAEVELQNEQGESMMFRVSRIADGKLTVDANHALAGQTVKFVVNVANIRDASMDEIVNGLPFDQSQSLH
ncbi:MAG: FKBP-type peptidyl-prolyl cis-trans isomerase [Sulfuricella denitrificans]|nr:FKBP-type peptidyl-prolyl cis-trans isomerase [Sulfuricella denitrificans]